MKFLLGIILLGLANSLAFGQDILHGQITSAGMPINANGIELNFSVGEIAVNTLTQGDINLNNGIISTSMISEEETKPVSIEDLLIASIRSYPNPVENSLNIHIPETIVGEVELGVFQIAGSSIIQQTVINSGDNTVLIDTSALPKGVYLLRIQTKRAFKTLKLLKL